MGRYDGMKRMHARSSPTALSGQCPVGRSDRGAGWIADRVRGADSINHPEKWMSIRGYLWRCISPLSTLMKLANETESGGLSRVIAVFRYTARHWTLVDEAHLDSVVRDGEKKIGTLSLAMYDLSLRYAGGINYNFEWNISFTTRQCPRRAYFFLVYFMRAAVERGGQESPLSSRTLTAHNANSSALKNRLIILALWLPSCIAMRARAWRIPDE